jgi:hypothetical protein
MPVFVGMATYGHKAGNKRIGQQIDANKKRLKSNNPILVSNNKKPGRFLPGFLF